jgi:hypothetical protein
MTVQELIEKLSKMDQSAVVCARYDNTDPFQVDNRARVIDGLDWSFFGSFETLTEAGIFELESPISPNSNKDFQVVILG